VVDAIPAVAAAFAFVRSTTSKSSFAATRRGWRSAAQNQEHARTARRAP
jgi:hypothetical protein